MLVFGAASKISLFETVLVTANDELVKYYLDGIIDYNQIFPKLLKSFSGSNASINGATQIRAGVMRPEIIIPINQNNSSQIKDNDSDSIISVNSKVRIIREPHFGETGKVTKLPFEPVMLETQTKARVAEIELSNGKKYIVPRSNLEVILGDK